MATVGELGEFPLIERITRSIERAHLRVPDVDGFDLRLGIGDDGAAWSIEPRIQVATTDTLVENIHFTNSTMTWIDLGWKAWVANVSDIVAMGAIPLTGMVTLGLPMTFPVLAVDHLYEGLIQACRHYETLIIGGDIVQSQTVFITVALYGSCESEPLRRDRARPGDLIGVSGPLGGSNAGLQSLLGGFRTSESLKIAHRRPMPRVSTGLALRAAGVQVAMDISDGLVADMAKICVASRVGAVINRERVPTNAALADDHLSRDAVINHALAGGEDYELVFTGSPDAVKSVIETVKGAAIIGNIVPDNTMSVHVVDENGNLVTSPTDGWIHFGRNPESTNNI